ncbi:MAG: hypothetical protein NT082_07005, partial [Chloroflexi bacterium]|nr:hypothetical protein [Chloroflexota bacterium]
MAYKTKLVLFVTTLLLISSLVVVGCGPATQSTPGGSGPIVIGYVGNTSSPGTRPCMDIMQMAVDEINASGGVLGRPLKLI